MPTRTPTIVQPGGPNVDHATLVTWSGLLNGDDGSPVNLSDFPDRTVQFIGTFGVGGSVNFEGSNNGTNWIVLTDPQGNSITKTAASLEFTTETPLFVRPNVTAGDGTTNLTVIMFARTPR
jgi:hypothetical protein